MRSTCQYGVFLCIGQDCRCALLAEYIRIGWISAIIAARLQRAALMNSISEWRMAGDHPSLSVVMPVFNPMPYLDKAIESILEQSFADFEFIIGDDGSTDGSWGAHPAPCAARSAHPPLP